MRGPILQSFLLLSESEIWYDKQSCSLCFYHHASWLAVAFVYSRWAQAARRGRGRHAVGRDATLFARERQPTWRLRPARIHRRAYRTLRSLPAWDPVAPSMPAMRGSIVNALLWFDCHLQRRQSGCREAIKIGIVCFYVILFNNIIYNKNISSTSNY